MVTPRSAPRADHLDDGRPISIADAIELIDVGRFHILAFILSYGVWFADGVELGFAAMLAPAISKDLQISEAQRASVVSIVFVGTAIGCGFGGFVGDTLGRRVPVLLSYVGIVVFSLLAACVSGFWILLLLRLALGMAVGIGMPASLALVSEVTPKWWRTILMGLRGIVFVLGNMFAILFVLLDDPSLHHVQWRAAFVFGAVPPMALGICAFCYLSESPVFLAHRGRHGEAVQILQGIANQNGHSKGVCDLNLHPCAPASTQARLTYSRQLGIVLGPRYAFVTASLLTCCITINMIEYGIAYAEAFVLQDIEATLSPALQLLTKYALAIPVRILVISPAVMVSRRTSMTIGMLSTAVGVLLFAWAGALHERGTFSTLLYYLSQYLPLLGTALGLITVFQLSIDVYPTVAAATGGAICIGGGRLGAIFSPLIFELLPGDWQSFFYMIAAMCVISTTLFWSMPDLDATKKMSLEDLGETAPLQA